MPKCTWLCLQRAQDDWSALRRKHHSNATLHCPPLEILTCSVILESSTAKTRSFRQLRATCVTRFGLVAVSLALQGSAAS